MTVPGDIGILFVAGFGPVVRDPAKAVAFYGGAIGLKLSAPENAPDYFHAENLEGVKHFAMWPLASAAESCFGTNTWPDDVPVPQAWIEFDVADIARATAALEAKGYRLLVASREEPWGQTVTRLLDPDGLLVGLTVTPWMRGWNGLLALHTGRTWFEARSHATEHLTMAIVFELQPNLPS
jgi:catechol 2,3-dioxygenase-like lactoylglutathione lyase family enzyme